jgi:FkbM family methyltransferase
MRDGLSRLSGNWRRKRILARQRRERGAHDPDGDAPDDILGVTDGLDLLGRRERKIAILAQLLGKSAPRTAAEFYDRMLSAIPDRAFDDYLLPDLRIKSCMRVSEELIRIEIQGGRAFFGQRSNQKEYLLHRALWPYLPSSVDGDSYKLALDVQRRYWKQHLRWFNSEGGVFVEGGCFTGLKAIRWHDVSPKPVRVLAVEIGQANAKLLEANIHENGLEKSIVPVHAGLWSESGEGTQKHSFSTRRFLETSDRWRDQMIHEEKVRLVDVSELLDENEVEVADYFNVQVNGAEIEVLKGAAKARDRVKVFDVAAYYSQNGRRNADVVRDMLTAMGCTIIQESKLGRITAVTPKFRDEIMARRTSST